jgi:hypothetical protein
MLRSIGFTDVRTITPERSAIYRAARAVSHQLRGKNSIAEAFRQDRAVIQAKKGKNSRESRVGNRESQSLV